MARVKTNFDSVAVAGTAAAPGAGAAVATIADASLKGAGVYEIEVYGAYLVGAPAAAEDNNLELRIGATVVGRILMPRAINVISGPHRFVRYRQPSTDITVNATGAATAGVTYAASVIASRVM